MINEVFKKLWADIVYGDFVGSTVILHRHQPLSLREEAFCLESMTRVGINNKNQRKIILAMVEELMNNPQLTSDEVSECKPA